MIHIANPVQGKPDRLEWLAPPTDGSHHYKFHGAKWIERPPPPQTCLQELEGCLSASYTCTLSSSNTLLESEHQAEPMVHHTSFLYMTRLCQSMTALNLASNCAYLAPCRSLVIFESEPLFLTLASLALQDLSMTYSPWNDPTEDHVSMALISKLSGLSGLKLCGYDYDDSEVQNLHGMSSLAIKKLVLQDCPGVAKLVLKEGAFPALQTLHLLEYESISGTSAFSDALRHANRELEEEVLAYRQMRDAVLSFPKLNTLLVNMRLMLLAEAEGLQGWYRREKISLHSHLPDAMTEVWMKTMYSLAN